ncbi:Zinc finger MYM-type protein 3 [Pseudolycoriella hygida]|uniref:Zinc finger MYM-type protein 3 n=1 Tax=Pseudolycoriella hygida TaxID=35572 RepID=A0A9Q0MY87_9DIPT|nr:Zinc finger MYM-type protein 3 [Pseudolycoriella hygida]
MPILIHIYVPEPKHMYSLPVVTQVPIPLPIPVPVNIPTTRNSANGIMKEIRKIQDKMPTDLFEAELLMMAEMVAGDKKKEETESELKDEDDYRGEGMTESNALGEDMLRMALKMASEYEEPVVDLESAMIANTIKPSSDPHMSYDGVNDHITCCCSNNNDNKFTFGVNAWKQWVMTKNSDIEKSSIRRKPFKSELLQLTADELFVVSVRKPNESEYAPDITWCIQQYLYKNCRIDNIFTDPYYEKFPDCLDDVANHFVQGFSKEIYKEQENEEDRLKCPVKFYEFYLSKCPEIVKTRNEVQPVPDSPVWYSTQTLGKESLCKMLHRVKMGEEINITSLAR